MSDNCAAEQAVYNLGGPAWSAKRARGDYFAGTRDGLERRLASKEQRAEVHSLEVFCARVIILLKAHGPAQGALVPVQHGEALLAVAVSVLEVGARWALRKRARRICHSRGTPPTQALQDDDDDDIHEYCDIDLPPGPVRGCLDQCSAASGKSDEKSWQ